jgi:hypothetical protein
VGPNKEILPTAIIMIMINNTNKKMLKIALKTTTTI